MYAANWIQYKRQCRLLIEIDERGFLRPLMPGDVTMDYVKGINHAEVKAFLMQPNSAEQTLASLRDYAQQNLESEESVLFGLFIDGRHRGNLRLHEIAPAEAWLGIALFDRDIWGQGWGSRSITALCDHCLDALQLDRVLAGIDQANTASIRTFSKAGFRRSSIVSKHQNVQIWQYG
jgi:RimJ/RimL family protein N-acetyltransferase